MKNDDLILIDDRKDDPTADGGDPYSDPRPSCMLAYVVDAENFHILATKGGFLNYATGEYGYLINPVTLENEHPVCLPHDWDQDPGFYYFWDFTISGGRAACWYYEEEAEEHTAVAGKFREATAQDFWDMDVLLPLLGTAKPVVQVYVVASDTHPEVALEVLEEGVLQPRETPYQLYLHPQAHALRHSDNDAAELLAAALQPCNCVRYGEGNPHWPCKDHPEKAGPGDVLTDQEKTVLALLIALAGNAHFVAEDSEDDGSDSSRVYKKTMAELNAALDALDELPDDQPGYSMGPASKAAWALRRVTGEVDAIPEVVLTYGGSAPDPTDAELLEFILKDGCQVVEYENKLGPSKWRVHWPHLGEGQKELYGTAREALGQAYKDFHNKE